MTLKEYVRNHYEENQEVLTRNGELFPPLLNIIDEDAPLTEDGDKVVFENIGIIDMTDDKFIINGGGDWQKPTKFEMTLVDGEIKTKYIDSTFNEGMDCIIFLSELFGIMNSVYDEWEDLAINLFDETF